MIDAKMSFAQVDAAQGTVGTERGKRLPPLVGLVLAPWSPWAFGSVWP